MYLKLFKFDINKIFKRLLPSSRTNMLILRPKAMYTIPKFMVFRHKLVSVIAIFRFNNDVQKPNVSYMIHDLSGDLDLGKILNHQNSY